METKFHFSAKKILFDKKMEATYLPSDILNYFKLSPIALVAHPLGSDSSKVASVLVEKTRLPDQKGLIVTFDTTSSEQSLKIADSKHVKAVDYLEGELIMSQTNRVICFDDITLASELIGIENLVQLTIQKNILFFLCTYGVDKQIFLDFRLAFYPLNLHMWKASFADRGEKIPFMVHQVNMTARQDLRYCGELGNEKDQELNFSRNTFQNTQKYCNILYPLREENLLRDKKDFSVSEIIEEYGFQSVLTEAPKIKELFQVLGFNHDQRHVIYTRFEDNYGIKILEAIGKKFKYNVVVINNDMSEETKNSAIDLANSEPTKPLIIITNTTFREKYAPYNISHLHFFDGDLYLVPSMISSLYKYTHYTIVPILTTHCYIMSRFDDSPTIEVDYYYQLREVLIAHNNIWEKINRQTFAIVASRDSRLGIMA